VLLNQASDFGSPQKRFEVRAKHQKIAAENRGSEEDAQPFCRSTYAEQWLGTAQQNLCGSASSLKVAQRKSK
jgi:hypothetical protein